MKLALSLLALLITGCASAPAHERIAYADTSEPVLLARSQAYELQVQNGRVVQVIPAAVAGEAATVREIRDAAELRRLYAEAGGEPPPTTSSDEAATFNGWAGLDCVRAGKACGQAPADGTPRVLVLVKFK